MNIELWLLWVGSFVYNNQFYKTLQVVLGVRLIALFQMSIELELIGVVWALCVLPVTALWYPPFGCSIEYGWLAIVDYYVAVASPGCFPGSD